MPITDANGDTIAPLGGWRILSDSAAKKTINLVAAPRAVRKISIEDTSGDAASSNITINAAVGELIDGQSSLTISTNGQRVVLESTGTGWTVVSTAVASLNTNDNLDLIADTLEVRNAYSLPTVDGTAGQVIKTDGAGNLSWQDDNAGSGGVALIETLNAITGATGDVTHDCTNSHVFHHSSISADFVPDFTEITIDNNQTTKTTLVLEQGSTGYRPTAVKVNGTGSVLYWEGTAAPTASVNAIDKVEMRIYKKSDTFKTVGTYTKHEVEIAAPSSGSSSSFSLPTGSILYLDASDSNSYGGSGTTWSDLSGEGNHATLVNSPSYSSANGLFTFNGSNQYASLPSGFADFSSGITLFFVANFGSPTNGTFERLIDLSNGANTDNIIFARGWSDEKDLYYDVRDGVNGDSNISGQYGIVNNTLATFAITDDGTNIKLYKNGSLLTSGTSNLPRNVTRTYNHIAKSGWDNCYLEGSIGVAIIWDRALSSTEISDTSDHFETSFSIT
jgi:hypothetical protein